MTYVVLKIIFSIICVSFPVKVDVLHYLKLLTHDLNLPIYLYYLVS